MGMSTHVIGFKPPDERWEKMKKIWDACHELNIEIPDEVEDYFDGRAPDLAGVEVELPVQEWGDDYRSGYQIKTHDIPLDVKIIRFYNAF